MSHKICFCANWMKRLSILYYLLYFILNHCYTHPFGERNRNNVFLLMPNLHHPQCHHYFSAGSFEYLKKPGLSITEILYMYGLRITCKLMHLGIL